MTAYKTTRTIKLQTGCKMYCVTIYNENLRKLNRDESLRITRLIITNPAETTAPSSSNTVNGYWDSQEKRVRGIVNVYCAVPRYG